MIARSAPQGVVLVIEDDPIQKMVATRLVKYLGHTVLTAVTGQEALSIVADVDVDVVLMDVCLPDVHGVALCPLLVDSGKGPPVIAVSISRVEACKCLDTGAVDFLIKPLVLQHTRHTTEP